MLLRMPTMPTAITRFAPSPSGSLHIGGARTALFCWAFARHIDATGGLGSFLLRIEDTDRARSSEASAKAILEDLAWLGIGWSEGPELGEIGGDPRNVGPWAQSARSGLYEQYFQRLLEAGTAYPAFESPEELAAMRAEAQANKQTFRYTQRADYDRETALARMETQEHVLRLHVPAEPIVVHDQVLGEITFTSEHFDDFVIRKKDGSPTYHFAVVVDDALMGVTHVLRGQEHLNNTPKHVALQSALGFETPIYAHMPLIFNDKGAKMSKRERDQTARVAAREAKLTESPIAEIDGTTFAAWLKDKTKQLGHDELEALAGHLGLILPEVSVDDFRRAGYLPGVICNFIALLGWTPSKHEDGTDREKFDMAFLGRDFELGRIGKPNARFDRVKLASFNQDALAAMSDESFVGAWSTWAARYDSTLVDSLGQGRMTLLAPSVKPRVKTLSESRGIIAFALAAHDAIELDPKSIDKVLRKGEPSGLELLRAFDRDALQSWAGAFAPEPIEQAIAQWCESRDMKSGKIAQPLRVAITGSTVSPPIGVTLAAVGLDGVRTRIAKCVEVVAAIAS